MSSYTVMESALVVTVDVAVLVAGGLERTVQVDLSTLDGTALGMWSLRMLAVKCM